MDYFRLVKFNQFIKTMRYIDRAEVEKIGRAGTYYYHTGDYIVARQMASYWLCADPSDKGYTPHAMHDGYWEAWITLWISQNVMPGAVCVDVGANFGFYTFLLAHHGCKVIAFEPTQRCFDLLNKGNELNGSADRVSIEQYAVTDGTEKTVRLWEVAGHLMNTTIDAPSAATGNYFDAPAISLDTYFSKKAALKKSISFIKIDAEGSEHLIWKGMQKLLADNPSCIVLMEFVPGHYPNMGKDFFNELLQSRNVSYVDYAGNEQPLGSYDFIEKDTEPFRMLVLRAK